MIVLYKHTVGTNFVCYMRTTTVITTMGLILAEIASKYEHLKGAAQPYVAVHLDTARPVIRLIGEEIYAVSIDRPELDILNLQNKDNGMFSLGLQVNEEQEKTLNKLIQHGFVRLLNINPIIGISLFRIYEVTPFARDWLELFETGRVLDRTPNSNE